MQASTQVNCVRFLAATDPTVFVVSAACSSKGAAVDDTAGAVPCEHRSFVNKVS